MPEYWDKSAAQAPSRLPALTEDQREQIRNCFTEELQESLCEYLIEIAHLEQFDPDSSKRAPVDETTLRVVDPRLPTPVLDNHYLAARATRTTWSPIIQDAALWHSYRIRQYNGRQPRKSPSAASQITVGIFRPFLVEFRLQTFPHNTSSRTL
ncbi:hypothetical protein PG990_011971 [Apiospora arundinis]